MQASCHRICGAAWEYCFNNNLQFGVKYSSTNHFRFSPTHSHYSPFFFLAKHIRIFLCQFFEYFSKECWHFLCCAHAINTTEDTNRKFSIVEAVEMCIGASDSEDKVVENSSDNEYDGCNDEIEEWGWEAWPKFRSTGFWLRIKWEMSNFFRYSNYISFCVEHLHTNIHTHTHILCKP